MSTEFCTVSNLSFSYPQQLTPLFLNVSFTVPRGWTGIVGANGSGKTTLVRLILGELDATEGSVRGPESRHHCSQISDEVPEALYDLASVPDAEAHRIIELLEIGYDWPYRWETLSCGERKRSQLAAALYLNPDLLVLDEPTNHLDIEATRLVRNALSTYAGIGFLISHDRSLLDALCERCIFFEDGSIKLRPGGVSRGLKEAERENQSRLRDRNVAKRELARLRAEAHKRRAAATSADAKRSKRHLARKDSDGRGKINLARVSGKDAVAGKLLKQMDHRLELAAKRIDENEVPPKKRLGITVKATAARRDVLFNLEAQDIALGEAKISIPELVMTPKDRIAVVGPNGAGKSTLLLNIIPRINTDRYLYIPQELSDQMIRTLTAKLRDLDSTALGETLSAAARLGSDPERLIETERPSPGEARKLMLALALTEKVEMIILDEPTNHMDLPSIRAIEEALANCAAALLFVTHDEQLAEHLATIKWILSEDKTGKATGTHYMLRVA